MNNTNEVYVIVETIPNKLIIDDNNDNYRIISVTKTYQLAQIYSGPFRKIVGPVPLISDTITTKPFDPLSNEIIKPFQFIDSPFKSKDINLFQFPVKPNDINPFFTKQNEFPENMDLTDD